VNHKFTTASVHFIRTKCYAAFPDPRPFYHALTICQKFGGKLAAYDDYEMATQNLGNFAEYKEAFGGSDCQWIGLLKKVWTWPSIGMLI